jgi:hypothetical protein
MNTIGPADLHVGHVRVGLPPKSFLSQNTTYANTHIVRIRIRIHMQIRILYVLYICKYVLYICKYVLYICKYAYYTYPSPDIEYAGGNNMYGALHTMHCHFLNVPSFLYEAVNTMVKHSPIID